MAYVVGIGGVRAAGKSTLARQLSLILRADIISTGRTREMIRAYERAKGHEFPELFESVTNTSSVEEAVRCLYLQAKAIKPPIIAAIAQCKEREANLIVEGTHILPGLYADFDLIVTLVAPKEKLEHRIHKDKKRRASETAIQRSLELQEHLVTEAKKHGTPVIDTTSIPRAVIEVMQMLPKNKAPETYFE